MSETLRPETLDQLEDAVAWAVAEQRPLEVVGRATKRALGRPMQTAATLDLSALSGIVAYEPEELVMTAMAGTPLAEIEAALAGRRQMLAFEPADLGSLLGLPDGGGSIGGVFSAGLAGPRRPKAGAARDHLLGFAAVSGRGERFKAGGKVVKNVTGYDLAKLMCGAWGTLAVLAELTFKVLPAPERTATVLVRGLEDARAIEALAAALGSPHEVAAGAHLPEPAVARSAVPGIAGQGAATALRLEGPGPSVAHRTEELATALARFGPVERLDDEPSAALWREIRDVRLLPAGAGRVVWKLSVAPTAGPRAVAGVRAALGEAGILYDWGGGLVWLALPAGLEDGGAAAVRAAVGAAGGGHATLVAAPAALRARVPVFEPQPAPLARLAERVKDGFDPRRILNPGRMVAGV